VDETTGYTKADSKRRLAEPARWPVLARLPDVSTGPLAPRSMKQSAPGAVEYRFDPPQTTNANPQSEIGNPKSANTSQPHVFERSRPLGQRGIPRRVSPILPHSNPFSIPGTRLFDSLAPAVRFLTMVALFTAAGTWFQVMNHHSTPPTQPLELPKTAAQQPVAPAKNAVDHTVPAPSATGPIDRVPETGARVGRANSNDFTSSGPSYGPLPTFDHPSATPPHFLVAAGSRVPRVQTTDSKPAGVAGDPAGNDVCPNDEPNRTGTGSEQSESEEEATVARIPGFSIVAPTR
jgi:hypothetical protein